MSASEGFAAVRLRGRGARRVRSGHPWVFRDDVERSGEASHGDLVRVESSAGEPLGFAFWSATSKIAVRMVDRDTAVPGERFWRDRIEGALRHRERLALARDAVRLVFGESDGIPGFVADLYGEHLVVQVLTAAVDRRLDLLLDALGERRTIVSVLARNDPSVRTLEGLPREVVQLRGTTPDLVEIEEDGVRFLVDLWRGQKTGAFLDQAENRVAAGRWARGRVLDAFAYHGSFALHAARRADEVVVLDASRDALTRARANGELNGLKNLQFVEGNAFDDLRARERAGERFDLVALDPPAFAKSRNDLQSALRGYREINLRAMKLLAPGGILVTSSCSYNLGEAAFYELLVAAAADAGVTLRLVERRIQAQDHPVRLGFPESLYLKCAILASPGGAD